MLPVAATIAFVYLLKPGTGPVNNIIEHLGLDGPLWCNSPTWAKPSLVLLGLWGIGDIMVIFLAAVLGVPASLYEAASLDGANAWHRFRYVTVPTIQPVILFAAVTGVIGARPAIVTVLPVGSLPKTPSGKIKRAAAAALIG